MLQMLMTGLLWFSAVGCGLLAGLYFAFSTFIMAALGRIGQAASIAAMNAINVAIVQSQFMPIFLATTAASAAGGDGAVALERARRDGDGGRRRALCARHVRRHGDLQRASERRACHGRPRKPRDRRAVGALSDGLDVVEPRADGVIHSGLRIVHCSDRGKVLTLLSVRDNCLAPVLRKSLQ